MTPQRVTLITRGVSDPERATAFYAAPGWRPAECPPEVVFYRMNGPVLGLFGKADPAADQGRPGAPLGTGAIAAGATALKPPEKVFRGGCSGYCADPGGHVWDVAMNPFWPLSEEDSLTLPDTA